MNWLKRATLNLTRRYVRTLILVVIFSVIAALLFSGISIMDASGRLENQAKGTVGSEVTLSWNTAKAPKSGQFDPVLMSEKQLDSLVGQPHVKDYNLINNQDGVADGFSVIGDRTITLQNQNDTREYYSETGDGDLAKIYLEPDLPIYGVRKSELSDQFVSGGYKLISGRPLTESDFGKNVALITKQLADQNGLKLGDTIHINDSVKQAHYPFKIVGIFTTPAPASKYLAQNSLSTPYNSIFLSYTQVGLFEAHRNTPYTLDDSVMTANFYLDDPENVAGFVNYAKKLLGDNYVEQSNGDLYEAAVMPLKSVDSASRLLAALTLVAGGIIFALIVVFSLRGRQREFGVLLAVGEKRKKILGQIFVEVLVPVIIAFGIGVAAGGGICGIIGNGMISQKAAAVQEQQNEKLISEKYTGLQQGVSGLVGKAVSASPIDKIDMSISARDLGLLAAACFILTMVSSAAPCISMMRYNPRQILQQK